MSSHDDLDERHVTACPECDSSKIRVRGSHSGYWCRDCREVFDEARVRKRVAGTRTSTPGTLAHRLERLDPDTDVTS